MERPAAPRHIRMLVVEDHKPFLEFICSIIRERPDTEVVAKARDGLEAIKQAQALQPDLILLDIGLPGVNGIEAAQRIHTLAPEARIIFLTQETSPDIVHEALAVGASGYVLKSRCNIDLPRAIETVLGGCAFVTDGLDGQPG